MTRWRNRRGSYQPDATVIIVYDSTGYDSPGRWGCRPEDSEAPEYENEVRPVAVYIEGIMLPKDVTEKLFEKFQEDILRHEAEQPINAEG